MSYWDRDGKFQNSYKFLWNKLVPPEGHAESREGNILITISHAYYRHFNDGDDFSDQLDINGMSELFDMKNSIDKTFLRNIYNKSYDPDEAVNETMRYLMISMSTKEKIWNPDTNRLVKINTPVGKKALEKLGCKLVVSWDYK